METVFLTDKFNKKARKAGADDGEEITISKSPKIKVEYPISPPESIEVPKEVKGKLIQKGVAKTPEEIEEAKEVEPKEIEVKKPGISKDQNKKLHVLYKEVFPSGEEGKEYDEVGKEAFLDKYFGVKHTNELDRDQATQAIEELRKRSSVEEREVVHEAETGAGAVQVAKEEAKREPVSPVQSAEEVKEQMKEFQRIVKELIDKKPTQRGGDIMYIDKDGAPTENPDRALNTYIVRSGLRKIALAFGLDMEVLKKEK